MIEYTNRYNEKYTFTLDEEGNIIWEGSFKWSRFGRPNDYSEAYKKYLEDCNTNESISTITDFRREMEKSFHEKNHPLYKYTELVTTLESQINMVDPSGGPYIEEDVNMGYFGEELKDLIVERFEKIEKGYKIIVRKNKI